jgi:LPS export ABC transporter protein LptC
MVYTDSLQIQAILTAPVHVDYSNLSFEYAEFPKGLKVVFFDDQRNENTVTADYGLLYNATNLIDLRDNVVLESSDGSLLRTDQLFWDAENEWLFTERPFTFENQDYDLNAIRLDTNKEFSKFQTGKLTGTIAVSEAKDSLNTL